MISGVISICSLMVDDCRRNRTFFLFSCSFFVPTMAFSAEFPRKLDDVLKVDNLNIKARQKFEKLHEFVKDILGEANAKEILGSDNLDEIDLSDLSIGVLKINDAYNKPLNDYKMEKMRATLNSAQIDKINNLVNSATAMANLPGAANA